MVIEPKSTVKIHSYKHDRTIHRVWTNVLVLKGNMDELVVANNKTRVVESNGRYWKTKEPAICFFYSEKWYNVIAMIKDDGIHYYCNISSPYVYDDEAIKYIDYDLDLRVDPNYNMLVLDKEEYRHHAKMMNYSSELKEILEYSLNELMELVKKHDGPFSHEVIMKYYDMYKKTKGNI